MNVCIDKIVFGTKRHICLEYLSKDNFNVYKSDEIPSNFWHYTNSLKNTENCFDTLLKLESITNLLKVPESYSKVAQSLLKNEIDKVNIPWKYFLPEEDYQNFIKKTIDSLIKNLIDLNEEYFKDVWSTSESVLKTLQPAYIDKELYDNLLILEETDSQKKALQSFKPSEFGFADSIEYDRFVTRTGRLTVKSGPEILTLKKDYRSIIQSRYRNGSILSLDFIGLEACILYLESHKELCFNDIYEYFNLQFFKGKLSRSIIKEAILCILFGMHSDTLASKLNISLKTSEKFIEKLTNIFEVSTLSSKLKSQIIENGYIRNKFGRKIFVPEYRLLVNSYIQSTGVDVSLLGFYEVINTLSLISKDIRPLFTIHDDIIIDCPKEYIQKVKESLQTVYIKQYNSSLLLKIKEIKREE